MRLLKTLTLAAAISACSVAVHAGGLAPMVQEAPIFIVVAPEATGSLGGYVVLGALAVLVAASGSF